MNKDQNKDKIDKAINIVAKISIIVFFIGAMVAIWVGLLGVKILLSSLVLFAADGTIAFLTNAKNKNNKKENEKGRR